MSVFSFSIYLLQNLVLKQRPFSVDSCCLGTAKSIMAANASRFWAHLIEVYQGEGVLSASRLAYDVRTPWERG